MISDSIDSSIIKSVPDTNTKEAILYGSEYIFAKSAKSFWDQVEDDLKKRLAEILDDIKDFQFASYIVRCAPQLLTEKNPPLEIDQIRDLRVLSEWINVRKALYLLEIRRKENDQYARLVGVAEYAKQRGTITETDWKAVILQSDDPLDYESIRAIKDMDEKLSEYETRYEQEMMNAYRRYRGMSEQELEPIEEYDEVHDEEAELIEDDGQPDKDELNFEIYKEIEIKDDDEGNPDDVSAEKDTGIEESSDEDGDEEAELIEDDGQPDDETEEHDDEPDGDEEDDSEDDDSEEDSDTEGDKKGQQSDKKADGGTSDV